MSGSKDGPPTEESPPPLMTDVDPLSSTPPATPPRAAVDAALLDELISTFEAALRASGRILETGAPRVIETELADACAVLGQYLRHIQNATLDDGFRAAMTANKVKQLVARYETWRATR
jgi:hypothetical protein